MKHISGILKNMTVWWFRSGWVALGLLTLIVAQWVDTTVFPVIDGFRVTHISAVPRGVEISGELHKPAHREACEFVEVIAQVDDSRTAPIVFLDRPADVPVYTRTAGWTAFGPWLILAPGAKTARLISRHRCHILWPHKTALAEITVKELP